MAGAGSDTLTIDGVSELHGCTYRVIPDRIEAGTFMVAAAVTHGKLEIDNIICDHLKPVSAKLREMGVQIQEDGHAAHRRRDRQAEKRGYQNAPLPRLPDRHAGADGRAHEYH